MLAHSTHTFIIFTPRARDKLLFVSRITRDGQAGERARAFSLNRCYTLARARSLLFLVYDFFYYVCFYVKDACVWRTPTVGVIDSTESCASTCMPRQECAPSFCFRRIASHHRHCFNHVRALEHAGTGGAGWSRRRRFLMIISPVRPKHNFASGFMH